MSILPPSLKPLVVPVIFALVGGLAVAFVTGALKWSDVAKRLSPRGDIIISPVENIELPEKQEGKSGYVAVYLTNGKMYFGRIDRQTDDQLVLTDVFFIIQTQSGSEEKSTGEEGEAEGATVESPPQAEFELVRNADHFRSPEDRLTLTRSHIVFWEPLRSDSRVVEAIKKYHETTR